MTHQHLKSTTSSGKRAAAKATPRRVRRSAKGGVAAKIVSGIAAAVILIGGLGVAVAVRMGTFSPELKQTEPAPIEQVVEETAAKSEELLAAAAQSSGESSSAPVQTAKPEAIAVTAQSAVESNSAPVQTAKPEEIVATNAENAVENETVLVQPAEPEAIPANPLAAYRQYVLDSGMDSNTRFLLRDINGDGIEELLLLRPTFYVGDYIDRYVPEWSNALCRDRKHLDVLCVGAYDGSKLIGLSGCSADAEEMWQIGVDVLPEYRKKGIASAITSRLAMEIAQRDKVPFYCSAWSNIRSVRNAIKSGFLPAWVEMTVKPSAKADEMNADHK